MNGKNIYYQIKMDKEQKEAVCKMRNTNAQQTGDRCSSVVIFKV